MTTASIIICTRNSANQLLGTLDALSNLNVPPDISCELLVVDNASTDQTSELMHGSRFPNMVARYLCEPRAGKSHGINTALRAAQGDILLFTDDDVRPVGNWVEGLCAPIVSGNADAVTGDVRLAPNLERPWMGPLHHLWLSVRESRIDSKTELTKVPELRGGNMAFSRDVLEGVPEFDTDLGPGALGLGDDTMFSLRLQAAKYRIVYASNAAVEHHLDESRLLRTSFLNLSQKRGRSAGYIAYHWEHRRISAPLFRLQWRTLLLTYWRARKTEECSVAEGMPEWEMNLLWSIYFYKQFLIERQRPPKYDPREMATQ